MEGVAKEQSYILEVKAAYIGSKISPFGVCLVNQSCEFDPWLLQYWYPGSGVVLDCIDS